MGGRGGHEARSGSGERGLPSHEPRERVSGLTRGSQPIGTRFRASLEDLNQSEPSSGPYSRISANPNSTINVLRENPGVTAMLFSQGENYSSGAGEFRENEQTFWMHVNLLFKFFII